MKAACVPPTGPSWKPLVKSVLIETPYSSSMKFKPVFVEPVDFLPVSTTMFSLTYLCLAKGIAGGVPMGAVLCAETVNVRPGIHGSTFGGNPLACAAGSAAIDFMVQHKLADRASHLGNYFKEGFTQKLPDSVRELRQIGLMIGIELKQKATPLLQALLDAGIIALPAGPTVIRLLPPLTIEGKTARYRYRRLAHRTLGPIRAIVRRDLIVGLAFDTQLVRLHIWILLSAHR